MVVLTEWSGGRLMTADQIRSLQPALAALLAKFRRCFRREPTFAHLETYVGRGDQRPGGEDLESLLAFVR